MDDDSDEYVPILGEGDSEEDAMDVSASEDEFVPEDEEQYLRGLSTGDDEEVGAVDGGEDRPLFADGATPESVLDSMAQSEEGFAMLTRGVHRAGPRTRAMEPQGSAGKEDKPAEAAGPSGTGGHFGHGVDDIWNPEGSELTSAEGTESRGWKGKGRSRARQRKKQVSEEVAALISQANLNFMRNENIVEAIGMMMEVVRQEPNLPDPYHLLGMLHEAVGNEKKALDFFMIAAHITAQDVDLWRRLAQNSAKLGLLKQAAYCYTNVLRRDKNDVQSRFERAVVFADLGQTRRAIEGLGEVAAAAPGHPEVPKILARLHFKSGKHDLAVQELRDFIAAYPGSVDATHVNILAELLAEARQWEEVVSTLELVQTELFRGAPLPADLQVKRGTALLELGQAAAAQVALEPLLAEPADMFADLYLEAGEQLLAAGLPEAAPRFLLPLAAGDEAGGAPPAVASLLADSYAARGDQASAAKWAVAAAEATPPADPGFAPAALRAARALRALGQTERARDVLDAAERECAALDDKLGDGSDPGVAETRLKARAELLVAAGLMAS